MTASDTRFQTPYGTFDLSRYPSRPNEPLQAWSAADTQLLEEVHQRSSVAGKDILVVNDTHGALCVPLQPAAMWTDSSLSAIALQQNQLHNERPATPVLWSTQAPPQAQLVVMRIPKQHLYLEYQLAQLARVLPEGATLVSAGMDKHLSPHTGNILERYIGPTQRHRGRQKARVFTSTRDDRVALSPPGNPGYFCEALGDSLTALPNVFSKDRLDIGSRYLLEHLHSLEPAENIIDLACGNGVLGLAAVNMRLGDTISFLDESAMAIASARLNAERLFPTLSGKLSFFQGDGLQGYPGPRVQLVICNPPFHLDHTVDEFAGRHLLQQCAGHLAPGGRLCLVANRHLNYRPALKSVFKRIEKLASNSKFNIVVAQKR